MTVKHGYLKDHFEGFGYKILKPVEINPAVSNEHEFNGVNGFRLLLGNEKYSFRCRVIYLTDDPERQIEDIVNLTWYDSRERHPTRSEFRLYYQSSECFSKAEAGDLLILSKHKAVNELLFTMFISKAGETITNQLLWLFGISPESLSTTGDTKEVDPNRNLDYFSNMILDKVNISLKGSDDSALETIIRKYEDKFPSTSEFSSFARSFVNNVNVDNDPDDALVKFLDYEEYLFRVFEEYLVNKKLKTGFASVNDFIEFSLSIHNRRKSRAGYALEHHLSHIFDICNIRYSHNKVTENNSKPDFIFPDIKSYRDPDFEPHSLTMLGVKTTCKDRWRQVLAEANRISKKHLCTLEPSISENQTKEMEANQLRLVVPKAIKSTYKLNQRSWLITISEFIDIVREKQIFLNG